MSMRSLTAESLVFAPQPVGSSSPLSYSAAQLSEQTMQLEFNLKNESEILETCFKTVLATKSAELSANVCEEVNDLIARIDDELSAYLDFRGKLSTATKSRGSQTNNLTEKFNLLKLKHNKLVLQVEKVYSNCRAMQEIASTFPRSALRIESTSIIHPNSHLSFDSHLDKQYSKSFSKQQQQQQQGVSTISAASKNGMAALSRILNKPPKNNTSSAVNISTNNYSTIIRPGSAVGKQLSNSNISVVEETILKAVQRESSANDQNREFIKKELIDLKSTLQQMKKQIDTHEHNDYDLELGRLRKENNEILHDYKILKNENTEIMHSIRTLSALAQEVQMQNQRLLESVANPQAASRDYASRDSLKALSDKYKTNYSEQGGSANNNNFARFDQQRTLQVKQLAEMEEAQANRVIMRSNSRTPHTTQQTPSSKTSENVKTKKPMLNRSLIPERSSFNEEVEEQQDEQLLSSWVLKRI